MIQKHIQTLNETGLALIQKATTLQKITEIEKCVNLGSDLMKQARDIMQETKQSSILIFVEFCCHLAIKPNYVIYLEFCARNKLEMLSEEDFGAYLHVIED